MVDLLIPEIRSVVTVGDGRGFAVQTGQDRLVVTAAHCLPDVPLCATFSHPTERIYQAVLGPLRDERTVWAECLFADPIGDIAVLGPPNNNEFPREAEAYDALVDSVTPSTISDPLRAMSPPLSVHGIERDPVFLPHTTGAWLLSLAGEPFRCRVTHNPGSLWVSETVQDIRPGMSGSPIIADDGSAIGVFCTSSGVPGEKSNREHGPNPGLADHLPGWLLREIGLSFSAPLLVAPPTN